MIKVIQFLKWYITTRIKPTYFYSRPRLVAWQHKKAQRMVKFAVKNSEFYREYYKGCSLDNWQSLPILNKKLLVENFSALNTAGISFDAGYDVAIKAEASRDFRPSIGPITVGLSSGTSGNRGIFLAGSEEQLAWAGTILAKMLPSNLFTRQRIAFFLRANNNLYTTLNSTFIKFQFYDLLDDIKMQIEKLNQFMPTILVAPPSMLRMLADAKKKNLLSITPIKIISVAEVLEPIDKLFIESVFNQTVHQIYQATEGFIAATCSYGTLHLNEDVLIVQKEYVDIKKKKFIPIVTDLYRTTQPIIRYRLNDILTERSDACPCGSIYTAIEQIDGRCDDLLYFVSTVNNALTPVFPDFIRRALITSSHEIIEYTVVQHKLAELEINLSCHSADVINIKNTIENNIKALCDDISVSCPAITFGMYHSPRAGDKLRRIIRKFAIDQSASW